MQNKHIVLGILAHVDAGKTTLSEALLYLGGNIRSLGRVDHKDAYFDHYEVERQRGITVFNKQARLVFDELSITLLDTPGHVDFSSEMERGLQVLDYAILVINGASGVQSHTRTLWNMLREYKLPTFLFVNKMDQEGTNRNHIISEIHELLAEYCVDFSSDMNTDVYESIALCKEKLMEEYLDTSQISQSSIQEAILTNELVPVYYGSALQLQGMEALIQGLQNYCTEKVYEETFAARVYKITHDVDGSRLTHMKITGGYLSVRDVIQESNAEKINQIRLYSGEKFEVVKRIYAGQVCAVTGLNHTYSGLGLGAEENHKISMMTPVLRYKVEPDHHVSTPIVLQNLKELEEEDPKLHVEWNERAGEIQIQLMGEVHGEIVQGLCFQRFGYHITYAQGEIMYMETITEASYGVGHFEPLRHYAEVHLLLEPLPLGSGIEIETQCSVEQLPSNYQQQVLEQLKETQYMGTAIGYPLTDLRITLINGKAHPKHTEGGDFREATNRALRQGLRKVKTRILEPIVSIRLTVPIEWVGRAMQDLTLMSAEFDPPVLEGQSSLLTGRVPIASMEGYHKQVLVYSGGLAKLETTFAGYDLCHNEEEVIERIGYEVELDPHNNADSVFCSHGAGFPVKWYEVDQYQHLDSVWEPNRDEGETRDEMEELYAYHKQMAAQMSDRSKIALTQEELDHIYTRTILPTKVSHRSTVYGEMKDPSDQPAERNRANSKRKRKTGEEYLLVDGYNVIHAWPKLKELAEINMAAARDRLIDLLSNYQGYRKMRLILVFDAYKVEGGVERTIHHHNIHVVYTREAETADHYIERTVMFMSKQHQITVATSDAIEQMIVLGQGALRMSAEGLYQEVKQAIKEMREEHLKTTAGEKSYLFDSVDDELANELESIRLGKK